MRCLDKNLINLYIDDCLSSDESVNVEAHVSACPKCNALLTSYKVLSSSTKAVLSEDFSIPENFINTLMSRIESIEHPSFEDISAYHDNFFATEKSTEIRNHLEDCYPCENIYTSINQEAEILDTLPEYDFSSGSFLDSLMSKIDELEPVVPTHVSHADLSAYADSEYSLVNQTEVKAHLDACAECAVSYENILKVKKSTKELLEPVLNIHFANNVIKEIEKQETKIVKFPLVSRRFLSKISIAAVVTGAMFIPFSRMIPNAVIQTAENIIITEHAENYIFSSGMEYKTDSIDIITESKKENLEIEDIGL